MSNENKDKIKVQISVSRALAEALQSAAVKDRRSRPHFIIHLLENSPQVKEASRVSPSPTLPRPVAAKTPWVNPAVPGSPCEKMYSPPESAEPDQSYDCPPVESFEDFQKKLDKGEVKLDESARV